MNEKELWENFLDNIKNEISNTSFDVWFDPNDTKFYSYKDDVITLVVKQELIKKHLESNYMDIMLDVIRKITDEDITFNILLESEMKQIEEENKDRQLELNIDDVSENQSSLNANLRPEYTFESFIVGNSNKFAYKASRVVAEAPGEYNPLFLYGESGVGKTHLMHAIGNYLVKNTNKKVLYVASDKFVDEYTKIFRSSDKNNFEKIDSFKETIEKETRKLEVMYDDRLAGIITLDEYMKNANRIKECVKGYEQSIKELEQELSGENDKTKSESRLDNLIEEFLNMEKPTKEIIREFIEKIEIHSDKQVDIYFNFKPLQELNNNFSVAKKVYEKKVG